MDRFFILYLYRCEVFKTNQQSFVFCIIAAQAAGRSNENIAGGEFFYQSVLDMLDASKGLAPGDPVKMAQRIIESVDITPAPLRMVLGSQALEATITRLKERIADYETQTELAASTDIKEN